MEASARRDDSRRRKSGYLLRMKAIERKIAGTRKFHVILDKAGGEPDRRPSFAAPLFDLVLA
jgi:hypothetical protein